MLDITLQPQKPIVTMGTRTSNMWLVKLLLATRFASHNKTLMTCKSNVTLVPPAVCGKSADLSCLQLSRYFNKTCMPTTWRPYMQYTEKLIRMHVEMDTCSRCVLLYTHILSHPELIPKYMYFYTGNTKAVSHNIMNKSFFFKSLTIEMKSARKPVQR